jgi:hypothetical protein
MKLILGLDGTTEFTAKVKNLFKLKPSSSFASEK